MTILDDAKRLKELYEEMLKLEIEHKRDAKLESSMWEKIERQRLEFIEEKNKRSS